MRSARLILLVAAAAGGIGVASPFPAPDVPVKAGSYDDLDACLLVVDVTGLYPKGDNYLSLRSRPSAQGRELARLQPGQWLNSCDESADGKWTGVVYHPTDKQADCGTGTPIGQRRPYGGPCASGWVATRFVKVIAG